MDMREVVVDGSALTIKDVVAVATGQATATLPSEPLRAVHGLVRSRVPRMDTDREVAGQIAAVDELLPEICRTARAACPGFS
jgi:histidine ammonia-lyase